MDTESGQGARPRRRRRRSAIDRVAEIHIGERIRTRRQRLGMSEAALAEQVGITREQVQRHERGMSPLSLSMLYRIAGALNASVALDGGRVADFDANPNLTWDEHRRATFAASPQGALLIDQLQQLRPRGPRRAPQGMQRTGSPVRLLAARVMHLVLTFATRHRPRSAS
jgi:transcriptional regulator with XRE-family HTH domain